MARPPSFAAPGSGRGKCVERSRARFSLSDVRTVHALTDRDEITFGSPNACATCSFVVQVSLESFDDGKPAILGSFGVSGGSRMVSR